MLAALKINILACNIKTAALKRFIDAVRAPGASHGVTHPETGTHPAPKRKLEKNGYRLGGQFRLLAHRRARGTSVL
jgi:hypothetical protein